MTPRRGRGIHRIPRAGPKAVAAKATSAAPAATACFTASPPSKAEFAGLAIVAGPCRDRPRPLAGLLRGVSVRRSRAVF